MNHQPFRDWLLSDEDLSVEQTQGLQEHLRTCESCRKIETGWVEVDALFHKVPQSEPVPGFTSRWQEHLAVHQHKKQHRRAWIIIGLTTVVVAFILILLGFQIWSILESPGPLLLGWLSRLIGLVSIYYTFQDIYSIASENISIFSVLGLFFMVGIISFMSVLWLTAYRKLSMARRLV
jgi:hypothetical protein